MRESPGRDREWHLQARCRGLPSAVFFTDDHHRGRRQLDHEHNAKRICASCPVLSRCREYALDAQEPYGIWGGMAPRERAAVLQMNRGGRSSA
ncbi:MULTISPECIES: WhiB family transcriptional regulator [unclassified Mycolicibacterium]|uniref:WhiB family transcriptional regulator n=1 Tax=unclassified Mycolicibacterium TaxID=2636767 RepID=UPI002ED933A6